MKFLGYILSTTALIALICACQTDAGETEDQGTTVDLAAELPGTWQTVQINVAINSADGRDTFRAETLTEEVWRSAFGMEPPVYYFRPDNKFRRVHRTLQGEIMDDARGMWTVFGDTLNLTEADASYQYLVRAGNGRATFRAFEDWDEDGATDDEFQSLHRKISIGVEDF